VVVWAKKMVYWGPTPFGWGMVDPLKTCTVYVITANFVAVGRAFSE